LGRRDNFAGVRQQKAERLKFLGRKVDGRLTAEQSTVRFEL
jgi:hypothetical protein